MTRHVDIVIVGSGFSGIGLAIQLTRHGYDDLVVLEKADDLGGTWRENTYPGCACDVPSYLYSFSFAPSARWSRMYPDQPEIWRYLRECAEASGVADQIEYGAELTAAVWDEASQLWQLDVNGAAAFTCRVLVSAVGGLHTPHLPDLPGLADFAGPVFHTAQWRHDVDLTGKRVAVVGTGASAVQVVPAVADQVAQLDVYQRTPAWILPRINRPIPAAEQERLTRHPLLLKAKRDAIYLTMEVRGAGFTAVPAIRPAAQRIAERHLARQVKDPVLRERLTPDYEFGCKRVLISSDFYPAVQRPNVELVTSAVTRLTPSGVVADDGIERPADVVVLATGFRLTDNLMALPMVGRDGQALSEVWTREGIQAHLGIVVDEFPNLFMLLGPNTGIGHTSVLFMVEAQIHFVLKALRALDAAGGGEIAVRADARRRSVARVQGALAGSVWQSGCRSWYRDGSGRNIAIWPHTTVRYWLATRRLARGDYDIRARADRPADTVRTR